MSLKKRRRREIVDGIWCVIISVLLLGTIIEYIIYGSFGLLDIQPNKSEGIDPVDVIIFSSTMQGQ